MSNDLSGGDSLENIHGNIHNTVGGYGGQSGGSGHMWYPKFSAFDPIFMLHHANVDRLFAIWQELNRGVWIPEHVNPTATFAIPANEMTSGRTPLKPFRKDDHGNFWTSDEVEHTEVFAYTYPELVDLNESNTLISRVNELYGKQSHPFMKRALNVAGASSFDSRRQYTIDITIPLSSMNGSLDVYIFLGTPSTDDTQEWADEQSFVGTASMVDQSMQLGNLKNGPRINGNVPLTAALEARDRTGELRSMYEADVGPYLRDHLQWKVIQASGELFDCDMNPAFQVAVSWRAIDPAVSADEFPVPSSDYQVLELATEDKSGGFRIDYGFKF